MQDFFDDLLGESSEFYTHYLTFIFCIVFGLLSLSPYITLLLLGIGQADLVYDLSGLPPETASSIAFVLGMLGGFPSGITGINFGVAFLSQKERSDFSSIFIYFGFFLSILGIICNIAFYFYILSLRH